MFLREITLRNLLSFGPETPPFALRNLNVLIGPNGSGKSNFIEAIGLLQAAPTDITRPVRRGGGIVEWLWKGGREPKALLDASVLTPLNSCPLRHSLEFGQSESHRFVIVRESVSEDSTVLDGAKARQYYAFTSGHALIFNEDGVGFPLPDDLAALERSILDRYKEPLRQPEMAQLGSYYERMKIYKLWKFGSESALRDPQSTDEPSEFLSEDYGNLSLVLLRIMNDPGTKDTIVKKLFDFHPDYSDLRFELVGNKIMLRVSESEHSIPAYRLSDGTLRYLCLLAILCHPDPPPLICIEEPELGMHPDALLAICKLIEEASERTQLIITTHSTFLLDYFTHDPEAIVVCEKGEQGTTMTRLDQKELEIWLKEYSLGNLWTSGQIGGNRW